VCLFSTSACHGAAKASEAHSCCQKTAGIQAVTAACCEGGSVLVMATPEVPEVGPPVQQAGLVRDARPAGVLEPVAPVRPLPPLPLERTTVLLI
jgi:hypothetical protein